MDCPCPPFGRQAAKSVKPGNDKEIEAGARVTVPRKPVKLVPRKADTPEKTRTKTQRGLPDPSEIVEFLKSADGKMSKREIARAFGVKGDDRQALKALLRDMGDEGLIARGRKKRVSVPGALPPVAVLDIFERDPDGELIARPAQWDNDALPPKVVLSPLDERRGPALGIGERVLARITEMTDPTSAYAYEGRIMRRLGHSAHKVLGVYRDNGREGRVTPVDRKSRFEITIPHADANGAQSGDLVFVDMKGGAGVGLKRGHVRERLGSLDDPRTISLIAVHMHGIPTEFPAAALAQAENAKPVALGAREDLRKVPLVTIDPVDARDHDDAVWAGPDEDAANSGGHVVIVAIADVAHYVTPGSALDKEALKRGNSAYFPDRVIPMLPERLSNTLCSLEEDRDRAVLAVRMVFDRNGVKRGHRFLRGLMRSAASLSYEQAQAAADGRPDANLDANRPAIRALFDAYDALKRARDARAPLDLDLPEFKVEISPEGHVAAIAPRARLEAHKLIEEFMIQANVAAAESLEEHRVPLLYRVHEPPAREKLIAFSDFLKTIDVNVPKAQGLTTKDFNQVLGRAHEREIGEMVSEIVLRTQSQAYYAPLNKGHFGLNLRKYAHFTSPIRRYADLVVHRALIRGLKFGPDGLTEEEISNLGHIGEDISAMERKAMAAERDSNDRYIAAFMADRLGATFAARIVGVTRFGLFVRLADTGADGLVPIGGLGNEYFHHDERAHALVGAATGLTFRLGDLVTVRLVEATPVTGGLRFELMEGGRPGKVPPRDRNARARAPARQRTQRGAKRRA